MRWMSLLTVCALTGAAVAAPPPGIATPAPSRSAPGRASLIDATRMRLDNLVGASRRDRSDLMIDVFNQYRKEQLEDVKRNVTIEMLFDVVKNDDLPKEVRQRAAEAIVVPRVQASDPTLSLDGRGLKRKRAEFSAKVNKLLLDSEQFTRVLGKLILDSLWPGFQIRKEIKACEPRDRNSCVEANKAWDRILKGN